MKYKFTHQDANRFTKHGINLAVYGEDVPAANLVYVEVEVGHLEEFYDDESTYMYLIFEGSGTFVLNDEKVEAQAKDLIVIPPKTRIHYFGKMKMALCVTPAFNEEREHHVRMVEAEESPYAKIKSEKENA